MSASSGLLEREEVLVAARRCFLESGVAATTMSEVATAAGISRRAVYRAFSGRAELVEAAIVARIGEIIDGLYGEWERHDSFAEALVETSVVTINAGRCDLELRALISAEVPSRLHHILAGPYPPVVRIMRAAWLPRFARARARGELRSDVTDDQIVEWLRGCYLQLMLRDDLADDPDGQRAVLRNFVLPSVLA